MPRVVLGGPGWNREQCKEVTMVGDLSEAVSEIEHAVGL
jgi:hypothetical protein